MVDKGLAGILMQISVMSFVFPIMILIFWRIRTKKSIVPAFAGILVFTVFARMLQAVPNVFFILSDNPISRFIRANDIVYALYGGITAAIIEETGRYLAYRYLLKKHNFKQSAITYGLGHGGAECIIGVGIVNIQYYMYAQLINSNKVSEALASYSGDKNMIASFNSLIDEIKGMTIADCILDAANGILFYVIQIMLSIIIFQAFRKEAARKRLFLYAIAIHTAAYLPNGLYQAGMINHIVAALLLLVIFAVALRLGMLLYRSMSERADGK